MFGSQPQRSRAIFRQVEASLLCFPFTVRNRPASGAAPFSLTLITQFNSQTPAVKRVDVNASFMGVTFSPDSRRVYLSGGENGNIWIGDAAAGQIIGSVNLNGPTMASAADTFRMTGSTRFPDSAVPMRRNPPQSMCST